MKTRTERIKAIGAALNAYGDGIQTPEIVQSTLDGINDDGICTLYGITGVFIHSATGKPPMPAKWQKQIHNDLLEAFCVMTHEAHAMREKAKL